MSVDGSSEFVPKHPEVNNGLDVMPATPHTKKTLLDTITARVPAPRVTESPKTSDRTQNHEGEGPQFKTLPDSQLSHLETETGEFFLKVLSEERRKDEDGMIAEVLSIQKKINLTI